MYMASFALLSIVGGWAAWRSNPLYSNRATLRFVLVVGLAMAAVVGSVVAVVNLMGDSPQTVFLPTMFAVILVATLGLTWVVITLSTPTIPALPASLALVRVHRLRLVPLARWFGIGLVLLAALSLALPGDSKDVAYAIGGLFVFIAVVGLFAAYTSALGLDRSLTAVESNPWIHWRYTPEQWKAWTDAEVGRLVAKPANWEWRRDWKRLVLPLGAVVVGVYVFDPGSYLFKTAYLAGLAVLMVCVIVLSERYGRSAPYRLHVLLARAAPEAYLGSAGVFAEGVYTQWQTAANYLIEATLDDRDPRSLRFVFLKIVPGANSGPLRIVQRVPIPAHGDADVARLQTSLAAKCPTARVALV
jgi:hypothetical protein